MCRYVCIFIFILALTSCKWLPKKYAAENAVARVNDKYLYAEDLKGIVPKGTQPADSVEMIKTYINSWVHQQLLVQLAEANLPSEKQDFERELELYKNSLLVYQYGVELLRQKLDTTVKAEEVQAYYNDNQAQFKLRENIVRGRMLVLPKNSPLLPKIRTLIKSDKLDDKLTLQELSSKNALYAWFGDSTWLPVEGILQKIPLPIDPEIFLSTKKYHEFQDSVNNYLVYIREYKVKEGLSPMELEVQNIKAIILNKRKSELIAKMEEDVFKEALQKKKFEIFEK